MTTPNATPIAVHQSAQSPASEPNQQSLQPIKRHDKFYISDIGSTSIFLVEDTHYKVHRYFLTRESSVFQTMFDCPHPAEGQDGESDEKPIHLPGVTCSEFEALLDFFYNGMFTRERKKSNLPEDNLQATYNLLSIALRYEFDRVTKEDVALMDDSPDDKDPVVKLCFGLAHEFLRHWVKPAYNAIIKRGHSLSKDDIIRLGAGRAAIVSAAREKYIRGYTGYEDLNESRSAWKVPPEIYSV